MSFLTEAQHHLHTIAAVNDWISFILHGHFFHSALRMRWRLLTGASTVAPQKVVTPHQWGGAFGGF